MIHPWLDSNDTSRNRGWPTRNGVVPSMVPTVVHELKTCHDRIFASQSRVRFNADESAYEDLYN
jgi:hypothetical protein